METDAHHREPLQRPHITRPDRQSNPPMQSEVQAITDRLDEILMRLKNIG
jgi:hypothetical protein